MKNNNKEIPYSGKVRNGFAMLALVLLLIPAIIATSFILLPFSLYWIAGIIAGVGFLTMLILLCGFFVLQPNQARVMIFFGEYRGTFRETGYFWVNPFMTKKKVSLRIRNMDIAPIKVNDKIGNPVMIGMVLVWKVSDTYRAVFDVDAGDESAISVSNDGKNVQAASTGDKIAKALNAFVSIQSDAALREVTGRYAYDEEDGKHQEITLRSDASEINEQLEAKLNERMAIAGIEVVEARLNYLAYAPEIAAVMLRRQQASAIISAREKIVEGAVSMVKMALDQLSEEQIVTLDEERKASMVSNLLVVLCADEPAQPVLNTGTLYQ
ncbi:SPFH domain-containing protein [Muribaculum intestinale]|uniref:SPFH domain-containing protein n=1 Tax=Muribaculum intestinale TaxID=1796646 RepID=UPI0025A99254|nr:SPFH domain-containing protein [Muribaculum intestinale]